MKYPVPDFLALLLLSVLSGCTGISPEEAKAKYASEHYAEIFYGGKRTPAEFASNYARQQLEQRSIVRGSHRIPYEQAVRDQARLLDEFNLGKSWKEPRRKLVLPELTEPPVIDGEIKAGEWAGALRFNGSYPINGTKREQDGSLWYFALYGNLLLAAGSFPDKKIVCCNNTNIDDGGGKPDHVANGDVFEFFIRPNPGCLLYYELLLNPDGTFWGMLHTASPRGGYVTADYHIPLKVRTGVRRTADGYSVEMAVPLNELYGGSSSSWDMMTVRINRSEPGNGVKRTPVPFLYDGHNIFGYITVERSSVNGKGGL